MIVKKSGTTHVGSSSGQYAGKLGRVGATRVHIEVDPDRRDEEDEQPADGSPSSPEVIESSRGGRERGERPRKQVSSSTNTLLGRIIGMRGHAEVRR
jgi:hypothetical protein